LIGVSVLCVAAAVWSISTGSRVPTPPRATVTAVQTGWKVVVYQGVHVDVPSSWPVVDGMHTGICEGPFTATPTAYVGPQGEEGLACPAPVQGAGSPPARQGVWLQPGLPPRGAKTLTTPSGQVLLDDNPGYSEFPIDFFWLQHVSIEVGMGLDRSTTDEIVDSIGVSPGVRNTWAAGTCARSSHPGTMPPPERLARRLVLNRGNFTFDPPEASDEAVMSAVRAWRESGPQQSFEHYRLILTRYSARLPAVIGPHGSFIPTTSDELAWVVLSAPNTPITGCGLWGVEAFDAGSGKEIGSSGYAPGP
jgi:hypothetical protein